jgi:hypothetical protein
MEAWDDCTECRAAVCSQPDSGRSPKFFVKPGLLGMNAGSSRDLDVLGVGIKRHAGGHSSSAAIASRGKRPTAPDLIPGRAPPWISW